MATIRRYYRLNVYTVLSFKATLTGPDGSEETLSEMPTTPELRAEDQPEVAIQVLNRFLSERPHWRLVNANLTFVHPGEVATFWLEEVLEH